MVALMLMSTRRGSFCGLYESIWPEMAVVFQVWRRAMCSLPVGDAHFRFRFFIDADTTRTVSSVIAALSSVRATRVTPSGGQYPSSDPATILNESWWNLERILKGSWWNPEGVLKESLESFQSNDIVQRIGKNPTKNSRRMPQIILQ